MDQDLNSRRACLLVGGAAAKSSTEDGDDHVETATAGGVPKMSIKLFLSSNLTCLAKGKEVFEVKGETLGECLNNLVSLFPVMKNTLLSESGEKVLPGVNLQVNQESADAEGLAKKVKDGDEIRVMLKRH